MISRLKVNLRHLLQRKHCILWSIVTVETIQYCWNKTQIVENKTFKLMVEIASEYVSSADEYVNYGIPTGIAE